MEAGASGFCGWAARTTRLGQCCGVSSKPHWNTIAVPTKRRSRPVAIAYVQEFTIKDGDTSTTNYDAVNSALNLQEAPDGLLMHTAGFDHDAGVFRIFDVWETREQGETFFKERLNPIIEPMAAAAMQDPNSNFAPPSRESW